MTLKQQVTSLELSKRLKELGVKQDSLFTHVWVMRSVDNTHDVYEIRKDHKPTLMSTEYSAFTVAELVRMFPRYSTIQIRNNRPDETRLMIEVENKWYQEDGQTTADTLATMLIYLLEHNLITLS